MHTKQTWQAPKLSAFGTLTEITGSSCNTKNFGSSDGMKWVSGADIGHACAS